MAGELEKHDDCLKEYTLLKISLSLVNIKQNYLEKENQLLNEYLDRKAELF